MIAFAMILLSVAAGIEPSEADVLAYGKRLNVNQIDSRLGSERYQAWLGRTLGPGTTITWSSGDCGEGGGDNSPLCIDAEAHLRPRGRVIISIAVGSVQRGLGGKPALFFGAIEGLGPSESIETGELPLLASKVRAAQALSAELSQRPDLPMDDDAWIRHVRQMPAARLVPGPSTDTSFGDWVAARAGSRAKVKWSIEGCGSRVDLTGDRDEWAFVNAKLVEPDAEVLMHVRVGTCRKGIVGNAIAEAARLYDKRRHRIDLVSLDALEARLKEIRARP